MFTNKMYKGASLAVALTLALSSANAAHAGGLTSMVKGVLKGTGDVLMGGARVTGDVMKGAGRAVGTTASATANAVGNTTTAAVGATGDLLGMHSKGESNKNEMPAKVAAAPEPKQMPEAKQVAVTKPAPVGVKAPTPVRPSVAKSTTPLSTEGTRISPPMPLEDQPIVEAPQVRTLPQTKIAAQKARPVVQQVAPVAVANSIAAANPAESTNISESPSWNETAPRYAIKTTPLVPTGK